MSEVSFAYFITGIEWPVFRKDFPARTSARPIFILYTLDILPVALVADAMSVVITTENAMMSGVEIQLVALVDPILATMMECSGWYCRWVL